MVSRQEQASGSDGTSDNKVVFKKTSWWGRGRKLDFPEFLLCACHRHLKAWGETCRQHPARQSLPKPTNLRANRVSGTCPLNTTAQRSDAFYLSGGLQSEFVNDENVNTRLLYSKYLKKNV